MDNSKSSLAVLAICVDTRSLPYNAHLSWQDSPPTGLRRSLADRLRWRSDVSPGGFKFRPPSPFQPTETLREFADPRFDIMEANSAADALALLRILRFDLGLIGADTLGKSVPSLLRKIQVASPGTRCIVVSSAIDERREQSIREAGVLAILDAPLPYTQLCDVVTQLAAGR